MADEHQRRLQSGVEKMLDGIDRKSLRPLQKKAYQCMAACFDKPQLSQESVQACVDGCGRPLQQVQAVLQQEMNGFQDRVQRCAMACSDEARDMTPEGAQPGDARMDKVTKHLNSCVGACVDKHVSLLPTIEARIKGSLG